MIIFWYDELTDRLDSITQVVSIRSFIFRRIS